MRFLCVWFKQEGPPGFFAMGRYGKELGALEKDRDTSSTRLLLLCQTDSFQTGTAGMPEAP